MKHYQGRISEILSVIYMNGRDTVDPQDFLPSKNIPKEPAKGKKAELLPHQTYSGGGLLDGDWMAELTKIYTTMSGRKDIQEVDALFLEYIVQGEKLANHVLNYLNTSAQQFSYCVWSGDRSKVGVGGTADVIVTTKEYPGGVHLSMKSTVTKSGSISGLESQTLGLYEEYKKDTTTDARTAVKELLPGWKQQRDDYCSRIKAQHASKQGIFRGVDAQVKQEVDRNRDARKLENDIAYSLSKLTEIAKKGTWKSNKNALWTRYKRMGFSPDEIPHNQNYQEELQEIEREAEENLVRKNEIKDELKVQRKQLRDIKKKIKLQIENGIVTSDATSNGWSCRKNRRPRTSKDVTTLVKLTPYFNKGDDLVMKSTTVGSRDEWVEEMHKTCDEKNREQVMREINGMLLPLVNKFVRRQDFVDDDSKLHLVVHSLKGVIPKSDMEFLKEFLRKPLGIETKLDGKTISIYGDDCAGNQWELMSIYVSWFNKVTRPTFTVNPVLQKTGF